MSTITTKQNEIKRIVAENGRARISKNAICQALKLVAADHGLHLTKHQLLCELLQVRCSRLSSSRYWEETHNILPWDSRTEWERDNARGAALAILRTADML